MNLALYIHWPFCLSKCPYCDFNSRAIGREDEQVWIEAYIKEIQTYADKLPTHTLTSIFFGGGTPSLMRPQTLEKIMRAISDAWPFADSIEISMEANPTTAEAEKFKAFHSLGIQRLSLGIQSFHNDVLQFLGRSHDAETARHALDLAQQIFPRVSFDLMYAYPQQTLALWMQDLRRAVSYGVKHLSLYQLTIEPHTPFAIKERQGKLITPDEALAETLYQATQDFLSEAGLPSYEISNHAMQGEESRHNMTYWTYGEYAGIGAGAHGRLQLDPHQLSHETLRWALVNEPNPEAWRQQVLARGHGALERTALSFEETKNEALLVGLRLSAGIEKRHWAQLFGPQEPPPFSQLKWHKLQEEGLAFETLTHWGLTQEGRKKLNAVLSYLL